jgi:hypothetical protein
MHDKTIIFLLIFFLFLFSLPLWLVEYPPLTDYPNHLLRITILKEFGNSHYNFSEYFKLRYFPVPNVISDYFILFLLNLCPLQIAGKIYLNLYIILLPLSLFYFLKIVDRRKIYLGFFGFFFIYSFYFNSGFLNYCGSIPLFFFALAYWWKIKEEGSIIQFVILSFLFLLVYFSHIVALCILIWVILLCLLLHLKSPKNRTKTWASLAPSLLLFLSYLFYLFFSLDESSAPKVWGYASPLGTVANFFRYSFISFKKAEALFYLLPLLLFGIFLIQTILKYRLAYDFKNLFRGRKLSPETTFLIISFSLLILYLALPVYFGGIWWGVNIRLVPFIFLLGLPAIEIAISSKFLKTVISVFIICLLILLPFYTWEQYDRLQKDFRDLISGISRFGSNQTLLPLMVEPAGFSYNTYPFWHAWAYYHIAKGGVGPYLFSDQQQNVFYVSSLPHPPSPTFFKPEDFDIKNYVQIYEYVLIWGHNRVVEKKVESLYSLIHHQGKLRLYEKSERQQKIAGG